MTKIAVWETSGSIWGASGSIWEASGGIREASGGIWEASGSHLAVIWEASGEHLGDLDCQGAPKVVRAMPAHKSGATLERNAKVPLKCQFYCVFLKVRFILYGNYHRKFSPAARPGCQTIHGPFINTVRTPTSQALFGELS